MEDEKKVNYICSKCGSEEVSWDAVAEWNPELQKMELSHTFTDLAHCRHCAEEIVQCKEIPYEKVGT